MQIYNRLLVLMCVLILAMPETALAENVAATIETKNEAEKQMFQTWSRTCALCHIRGEGGAPRIRNTQDWQARVMQGQEALLRHTIEGYKNMPPLGYCMSCERSDFIQMIDYMSGSPNE